ncbi:MAG: c-type cytochrome [Opitutales bacterium]|nr:c-type cytochrome [Opitutales bacterium]
MPRLPLLAAACLAVLSSPVSTFAEAQWIWTAKNNVTNQQTWARTVIDLKEVPAKATLLASADNHIEVWVNGQPAGKSDEWAEAAQTDVTKFLKPGRNTISVLARNDGGIAALVVRLESGKVVLSESNAAWRVTNTKPDAKWQTAEFDDAKWEKATVVKPLGEEPWGNVFGGAAGKTADAGKRGSAGSVAAPESLILQPGFKAELLYTVPKSEQGSWVSLAVTPTGDLVAGDQGGVLWHVSLKDPAKLTITKIDTKAIGCHGLLFAHGALYACTSEKGKGDIWRLRDVKGDGSYAEQTMIRSLKGSGEHGPHQLVLDRDGSILVVGGNHTKLPDDEKPGAPVKRYDEDDLLKKFEDANGHASGIKAVGGWIARMDKDGKDWVRVTASFRNPYDCSIAPDGDIFTYDSDMEWDMGAPWYRPTRIYLCTPGGELGWRSGASNNTLATLDMQPALVDVGPGSPTGTAMGTGAKFPAAYQRTFYACDWTFATLYAIHLTPEGGGWKARKEVFAAGRPFSVTDVVIRPQDGHMYVTIGGRGGQSALYRITYQGTESTAPAAWFPATPEQKLRRELEALRDVAPSSAALAKAWPLMGHPDLWVRFAARIAVEHQPVAAWRAQVKPDANIDLALNAAVALARCGTKDDLAAIVAAAEAAAKSKDLRQQQDRQRIFQVAFSRHGRPDDATAGRLGKDAAVRLPSGNDAYDRQLAQLAIFLGEPSAPARVLQAMKVAQAGPAVIADPEILARHPGYARDATAAMAVTPSSTRIGLAVYLCRATVGWTPNLRKEFFGFLDELSLAQGGNSLKGFVRNIRKEAVAMVPAAERAAFEASTPVVKATPIPAAQGPGRLWTHAEALKAWENGKATGTLDFANGQKMFAAALCSQCHRMGGAGGAQGPDLTGLGVRTAAADMLTSIIQPSAVVSDQYANSEISRVDGGKTIGRILNEEGDKLQLAVSAFDPSIQISVNRSDILAIDRSTVSPMPAGLLNSLNEQEVVNLMAYLLSGGNAQDKVYKK